MTVQVYKDRKALVLQWETGDYEGPVEIHTVNASDEEDVSSTKLYSNPGYAAVTFPNEYSGSFHATVTDEDGGVLDEGDVEVA